MIKQMDYAATNHTGDIQNAQRAEATAIAPSVKRVRRLDATPQGRTGNPKGQTAVRSHSDAADGFLRTSFLPRLEETETVQACRNNAKMEREFYTSLSQLAGHYGITPKTTQSLVYPYNIALALKDTGEQLKQKVEHWEEIRLVQDGKKTFLTSGERYSTGATLYYIPVIPLFRWLKDPYRKQTAQLLLSVCSYLYHIGGIPYYREENSYLHGMYEMHKDWVLEDDYGEDTKAHLSEIGQVEWLGDLMGQKIYNYANLQHFKDRIERFKPKDTIDRDCLKVAQEAYAIYQQYPDATVFRNVHPDGEAGEYDMETILSMEKYVSFCADSTGWLMDNIIESVNNELQEYGQMEEPMIIKRFNGSGINVATLEFESRLLPMMDELTYILNNF